MEYWGISYTSLCISASAVIVALFSFYFSIKSWRETNRPIVVAKVATKASGNVSILLDIIVENVGNRPAKEVRLSVDSREIESIMLAKEADPLRAAVHRCFSKDTFIPILENGRRVSSGFGSLTRNENNSMWKHNAVLNIILSYKDLDDRKFKHGIPILITDDTSFAGTFWKKHQ